MPLRTHISFILLTENLSLSAQMLPRAPRCCIQWKEVYAVLTWMASPSWGPSLHSVLGAGKEWARLEAALLRGTDTGAARLP